jgi:DNA-binding transcriptional LysR family regulator
MIIDTINLNHLRIFECVYRTRSMTAAAQELHLTQSGVSQHVKAFEDVLGVRLFDRIKQRLVPTKAAGSLFERCKQSLYSIEEVLSEVKGGEKRLSGTVTVGMPIEFGNNVVVPLLSRFGLAHPGVRFALKLGFASAMNERLLTGEIDFAFVDQYRMDPRIETRKVYDEILDLCASPELLKRSGGAPKHARKYFEGLDYVEYQKDEPILRMWFEHHLDSRNLKLNVKATVMDVQGLARLVLSGLGAGVLPHHLVLKLQKEGHKLHAFKGCGKPLKNGISVAYLRERTQSPAAQAALDALVGDLKPA